MCSGRRGQGVPLFLKSSFSSGGGRGELREGSSWSLEEQRKAPEVERSEVLGDSQETCGCSGGEPRGRGLRAQQGAAGYLVGVPRSGH